MRKIPLELELINTYGVMEETLKPSLPFSFFLTVFELYISLLWDEKNTIRIKSH